MATADDRRTRPGTGAGAGPDEATGPIKEAILSAIKADGRSLYAIARAAGVSMNGLSRFDRRGKFLLLSTADKLAVVLRLKVVPEAEGTGAEARPGEPSGPFTEALHSALKADGRGPYILFKASGVHPSTIYLFADGEIDLRLSTADKLAAALGLKVVRDPEAAGPESRAVPLTRPIRDALMSALKADGRSAHAVGKAARVDPETIRRFLRFKIELKLSTADRIAAVVGLRVVRESEATGPEPGPDDPASSLSEALRSAVKADGRSAYELNRVIGLNAHFLRRFLLRESEPELETADKLFNALALKLVQSKGSPPEPKPLISYPPHLSSDVLRAKVDADQRSRYALAKESGVSGGTISRLLKGDDNLNHATRIKLAEALARSDAPPPSPAGPIADVARRCPVELRGEGFPIIVHEGDHPVEVPKLSGVAYECLKHIVEGFHKGGGYTPGELRGMTGSKRAMRLLGDALNRNGFEPLRRMIPAWDAGRNKVVEIVDAGPRRSVDRRDGD